MRRSHTLTVLTCLALGACSQGEVVVQAEIETPDPASDGTVTRTLSDIEVELIPFDRDEVFDSMAAAAPTPEPEIPPSLLEAQDSIAAAQQRYQSLNARWASLRDSLQTISEAMDGYNPAEPAYRDLFRVFNDLDGEVNRLDRLKTEAFDEFTSLQNANVEQSNQVARERQDWAAEAFAGIEEVFTARMRESGRDMIVDTTNAQGVTDPIQVPPGQWWVHARYELPFTELYWNVPVEVPGGEPTVVELNRSTAEERPKL
jgi:hypothetical protein